MCALCYNILQHKFSYTYLLETNVLRVIQFLIQMCGQDSQIIVACMFNHKYCIVCITIYTVRTIANEYIY